MPGVSDLDAVTAAFPGAEVVKDQRLGGAARAELSGKPGIRVRLEAEHLTVWLSDVGGTPRVAHVAARVQDACKGALAALGDHAESGSCRTTNRKFQHDEHVFCAATPDGGHKISIECDERSSELTLTLDTGFTDEGRSELVAPAQK
jgi:hypothetical protein